MDFLNALKERIPDYAKDIRLNLDATIGRSILDPADALGAALAAAFARTGGGGADGRETPD
jgi:alkyl hydroperoxide reductase subunit D